MNKISADIKKGIKNDLKESVKEDVWTILKEITWVMIMFIVFIHMAPEVYSRGLEIVMQNPKMTTESFVAGDLAMMMTLFVFVMVFYLTNVLSPIFKKTDEKKEGDSIERS